MITEVTGMWWTDEEGEMAITDPELVGREIRRAGYVTKGIRQASQRYNRKWNVDSKVPM